MGAPDCNIDVDAAASVSHPTFPDMQYAVRRASTYNATNQLNKLLVSTPNVAGSCSNPRYAALHHLTSKKHLRSMPAGMKYSALLIVKAKLTVPSVR